MLQDLELQPLASFLQTSWNCLNKVPVAQWLASSQSDEDRQRLHALGNIAVPACGQLAGEVLLRICRLQA